MSRRAKWANITAAVGAVLIGGIAAEVLVGALSSVKGGQIGTVALVENARPDVAPSAESPDRPGAASEDQAASSAASGSAAAGAVASAESRSGPAGTSASGAGAPGLPMGQPAPAPAPAPAVSNPPPAAPTKSDCAGSDDGLTEAQKKAREAACEAGEDD